MKLSFSDISNSKAYQVQASAVSKANITVATVTAICIMIFASWGFGVLSLLVIPLLWFAVSILIAMPFMMLRVATVSALSETPSKARIACGLIDFVNYVLLVAAIYFGLRYLHSVLSSSL